MTAELNYQHPKTACVPPRWAQWCIQPLQGRWRWLPTGLVVASLGASYFATPCGPFDPILLYSSPTVLIWFHLILMFVMVAGFAGLRQAASRILKRRYRIPDVSEPTWSSAYRRALIAAIICLVALAMGVPMRIAFILRVGAMNDLRDEVNQKDSLATARVVAPFFIDGGSKFDVDESGHAFVYLDLAGNGGSGFLYVPKGGDVKRYQRGPTGWIIGRWYWYVDE